MPKYADLQSEPYRVWLTTGRNVIVFGRSKTSALAKARKRYGYESVADPFYDVERCERG